MWFASVIPPAGATDAAASTSSSSSFVNGATSKNLPAVQTVAPMPEDTVENMRYNTVLPFSQTVSLLYKIYPKVDFSTLCSFP